jgi:hypothetical protein
MKTIVDMHCHGTDCYEVSSKAGGRKFYGFLQPEGGIGAKILDRCQDAGLKQGADTLVGMINFDDNRARAMMDEIELVAKVNNYETQRTGPVLNVDYEMGNAHFLAGQEIRTNAGDVLVLGNEKNIDYYDFKDVLKSATDQGLMVFGAHVENPIFPLRIKDVLDNRNYFDGIDMKNIYGIPFYAASDSHTIDGMLSYGLVADNLDCSNFDKIGEGLRKTLKKKTPETFGEPESAMEFMRHMASVAYAIYGLKRRWLQRKS